MSLIIWSLVTVATGLSRSGSELLWLRAAMGISESLFMPPPFSDRQRILLRLEVDYDCHSDYSSNRWYRCRKLVRRMDGRHGSLANCVLCARWSGLVYAVPYFAFLRT